MPVAGDERRDAFVLRYGGVYEHSPWVAERAFPKAAGVTDPARLAPLMAAEVDRAGLHRAHARLDVAAPGEEHDGQGHRLLQLEAADTGHADIEYGDIGLPFDGFVDGLLPGGCFRDDTEVILVFKECAQSCAHFVCALWRGQF